MRSQKPTIILGLLIIGMLMSFLLFAGSRTQSNWRVLKTENVLLKERVNQAELLLHDRLEELIKAEDATRTCEQTLGSCIYRLGQHK